MSGSMRPSDGVLRAFGTEGPAHSMPGGRGGAWKAGDLVLKRSGAPLAWLEWQERLLQRVEPPGLRVQRPRRSGDGELVVDGWTAFDHLAGSHAPGRWVEIIAAGDVLHAALLTGSSEPPPATGRTDPWAIADRVAWGEQAVPAIAASDAVLGELLEARRPVRGPSQPVHGDLTGNVLFADGLDPAIIDFSPYVRPASYAVGVIVADAVVWEGAGVALLDRVAGRPDIGQCLLRALIFRHLTAVLLNGRMPAAEAADRYADLRRATLRLASEGAPEER